MDKKMDVCADRQGNQNLYFAGSHHIIIALWQQYPQTGLHGPIVGMSSKQAIAMTLSHGEAAYQCCQCCE